MNPQISAVSEVRKTMPTVLPVLMFCFMVSVPFRAQAADAGPPTFHGFDGGTETIPVEPGSREIDFYGRNLTRVKICDFKFELIGANANAKIREIKVIHRVDVDGEGNITGEHGDADWDVDDDMSGNSQDFKTGSPVNETDNRVHTPDQRARVDYKGMGEYGCCGGSGGEGRAEWGSEERLPGSMGPIVPGNRFRIRINLTGPADPKKKGGKCQLLVAPSTRGNRMISCLPDGLGLGESFCHVGYIHPAPGICVVTANNTGHSLVGLDIKPNGGLNVTGLTELDPQTEETLCRADCSKKTAEDSYRLPLSEPVNPGGQVLIDATFSHFEPQDDTGLVITPITEPVTSVAWPGMKGVYCSFIASGENYGNIGDLVITNTTDRAVTITVPNGLLLDSGDPRVQDLCVADVPTESPCCGAEELDKPISIGPGKAHVIKEIPGFCPDFELKPPEKGTCAIYTAKQPDEKSQALLATVKTVKDFDVSKVKLEVFEEDKAREMICQGACWIVDSRIDEVAGNEVTAAALTDRYWGAFEASAKEKLDAMTPEQREESEKLVKDDLKEIVAATSFIAKN